jgi:hypothetical protein
LQIGCVAEISGRVANRADRVLALSSGASYARGDIVAFKSSPTALLMCGAGGTFVERIIELPGGTVQQPVSNGAGAPSPETHEAA